MSPIAGKLRKKDAAIQIVRAIVYDKTTDKGKEKRDAPELPQHQQKLVGILIPTGKEKSTLVTVIIEAANLFGNGSLLCSARRYTKLAAARNPKAPRTP